MFAWLKKLFTKDTEPFHMSPGEIDRMRLLISEGSNDVAGLDFKSAIGAHLAWKNRLRDVINGSSKELLNPVVVAQDNQCTLGKWIHGEGGEKFGTYRRFSVLCVEHAKFHQCAATVLRLAQAGSRDEAAYQLRRGDYALVSTHVIGALVSLLVELDNAEKYPEATAEDNTIRDKSLTAG